LFVNISFVVAASSGVGCGCTATALPRRRWSLRRGRRYKKAVYNIIKALDQLRQHNGRGQFPHDTSDAFGAEKRPVVCGIFHGFAPFFDGL